MAKEILVTKDNLHIYAKKKFKADYFGRFKF